MDSKFVPHSPPGCFMNHDFHIGDKVVYPNHGVGIVEQIGSRMVGSMMQKYYELHIKSSNLKVTIPFCNVEAVGLRKVIKSADIEAILDILVNSKCENHQDWKFRFKENSEKMRSGSIFHVAEVFKNLVYLSRVKPLSFREKRMLDRARFLLISELSTVMNLKELEVEERIEKTVTKACGKVPVA